MTNRLLEVFQDRIVTQNSSSAPTITISEAVAVDAESNCDSASPDPIPSAEEDTYDGIDWQRLKNCQKPFRDLKRTLSWVWAYYYRVQSRVNLTDTYAICKYCHIHKLSGGIFKITDATSSATKHLASNIRGHRIGKHGPINRTPKGGQRTLLQSIQMSGIEVPQAAANELNSAFSVTRFRQAYTDWIIDNNHPLSELETPAFRHLIQVANPLAEEALWRNHQSVWDQVIREFELYIDVVKDKLARATSKIHISFNG